MTRVYGRVEGVRELRRSLRAAGDDLGDLKEANQATGQLIANAAGTRTPVRTGALLGSVRPAKVAGGVVVRAGSRSLPYAGPVHWGWPARNISANPFLVDAAHATEEVWLDYYFAELQRVIDKVGGAA